VKEVSHESPPWCKPAFWGVVVGAVGIMILGFAWWGWVLGSTAERMASVCTFAELINVVHVIRRD
jgi:hypothetical protein